MDRKTEITIQKTFGMRLRQLRHACGFSQERLAQVSNLDRSYIGQVERGERNISLINIHKVALSLGVQPYEVLLPPEPTD